MAPTKKNVQKMSLTAFMADETFGNTGSNSWADEMEDMPTVPSQGASSGYGARRDYGNSDRGYGGSFRDGGRGGDREDRYPPREALPLPEKPPYTAHVGNLSWDVTEEDISNFFHECNVANVRLVRDKMEDRPKGFGYVEFGSLEGLVKALDLSGTQFSGRNVRVSVAEPPKDRGDDRTAGEWRRAGPLPPLETAGRRGSDRGDRGDRGDRFHSDRSEAGERSERRQTFKEDDGKVRDFNNWERKGPLAPIATAAPIADSRPRSRDRDRRMSPGGERSDGAPRREFRERPAVERQPTAAEKDNAWRKNARPDPPAVKERSTPASPVIPQTRPKLELKKRSENPIETPVTPAEPTPTAKFNPFGAARPIDTDAKLKEIEEKRAAAAAAKKEEEEKLKEEKAKAEAEKAESPEEEPVEQATKEPTQRSTETPAEPSNERPSNERSSNERPTHRQSERQPDRHDRPTERRYNNDRHSDRQGDRQGDRQSDRQGDRQGEQKYRRNEGTGSKGVGGNRDWSNVRRGSSGPSAHSNRRASEDRRVDSRRESKAEGVDEAKGEMPATPTTEDGWSTVSGKRSRGGANGKVAIAS